MGVIKQIRKRANQRLAEPLTTTTALSIPAAVDAIKNICQTHNDEVTRTNQSRREGGKLSRLLANAENVHSKQYHVTVRQHDILIGYQVTPEYILRNAKRKRTSSSAGWWLARVRFVQPAEPLPAGQHLIEIRLTNWVMDSNGKLNNQPMYEWLTNELWKVLSVDAT